MTNRDLIQEYISGDRKYGAVNHLGFTEKTLWNYSTVICEIDRGKKTALFNKRKYSATTSKIQSMLRRELDSAGYTVTDYSGNSATMWNYGYMGAGKWKISDFKE